MADCALLNGLQRLPKPKSQLRVGPSLRARRPDGIIVEMSRSAKSPLTNGITDNELEAANRAEAMVLLIRAGYRVYRPEADAYGEDLRC